MNLKAAKNLALALMREHNLLELDWSFVFDSAKKRFGYCSYVKKQISLSRHLVKLNSERDVRNTILHEIAHALTPRAGHGPKWKAVARSIGCNGQRCYSDEVHRPKPKYKGACPSCGVVVYRHRRDKIACTRCWPRRFVWTNAKADEYYAADD